VAFAGQLPEARSWRMRLPDGFGYKTIAEGVEDAETLALLADYGVDFAQGFYLGRPTPIEGA
jgi:EAL domain-containing protein (putative c-di-GMP-specific phosphodiesterase class I)